MLAIIITVISGALGSLITIAIFNHIDKYGTLEISSTEEADKCLLKLDTLEGLSKKKRIVLKIKVIK